MISIDHYRKITDTVKELTDTAFQSGYLAGLRAASNKAINWADECCGGSGDGGEGYRNLAAAIRRIDPKKGY